MYHHALLSAIGHDGELESEQTALLEAILASDADTAVRVLTARLEQTRDMMLPLLHASAPTRSAKSGADHAPAAGKP